MNKELLFYKFIGNNLPKFPKITGLVNRIFKNIYFRTKERKPEKYIVDVYNLKMELEPFECVDGGLFFYPQLYDNEEFSFLREILTSNDTFLDIGANIGIYTLLASSLLSEKGKVVSIEADPYNYQKLLNNIRLNNFTNIIPLNIGVSDKSETLSLGINDTGNRGGNSFHFSSEKSVRVNCQSLLDILTELKINTVKMMKIDIEGFEYKVLYHFFNHSKTEIYPEYILIEHLHVNSQENAINLLIENGYVSLKSNKYNTFLKFSKR